MHEPLINRELLSLLRLVHGGYNLTVFLLFVYQARLGLRIRRARKNGAPLPFGAIKRHRKTGPVFAGLALFGFLFGIGLVLVDTGNVFEYPPHLALGIIVVLLVSATVILSRRIKGQDSTYRKPHFAIGVIILAVYVVDILVGIVVLF